MVVIKIELHPNGDASRARTLGTAEIANDGSGTETTGNYVMRLLKWGPGKRTWKIGKIRGFPRLARGPWDLLFCGLASVVADRLKGVDVDLEYMGEIERADRPAQQELFEGGTSQGKPGHAR